MRLPPPPRECDDSVAKPSSVPCGLRKLVGLRTGERITARPAVPDMSACGRAIAPRIAVGEQLRNGQSVYRAWSRLLQSDTYVSILTSSRAWCEAQASPGDRASLCWWSCVHAHGHCPCSLWCLHHEIQGFWSILPVVICFFQGLSHANVSGPEFTRGDCVRLIKQLMVSPTEVALVPPHGITALTGRLIPG